MKFKAFLLLAAIGLMPVMAQLHQPQDYDLGKPCVAVISDIHIGHKTEEGYKKKMTRVLTHIKQHQPRVRQIIVIGDLSNQCLEAEYREMMRMFSDTALVSADVKVTFVRGNHDNFKKEGRQLYADIVRQPYNQYQDIDGYPFITIGCDTRDFRGPKCYSQQTLDFLSESLKDAAEKYAGKPIFVFNHVLPLNTIAGSVYDKGWRAYAEGLDEIFRNYPQVIDFSGHTHISILNPEQIYQRFYTAVNDGGERNNVYTLGGNRDYSIHEPIKESLNEGLFIHFNKQGAVVLERWNLALNERYTPDWVVAPPFDGTNFAYKNQDGGQRPAFGKGTRLKLAWLGTDSCQVVIPQATDDEAVIYYNVKVTGCDGKPVRKDISQMSMQHRGPITAKSLTLPIGQLPAGRKLTCTVVAYDGFKQPSRPLSIKFKTKKK